MAVMWPLVCEQCGEESGAELEPGEEPVPCFACGGRRVPQPLEDEFELPIELREDC